MLKKRIDYYPFGMPMPNRNIEGNYRYGYQGEYAEKEPELGNGQNSFQVRLYDSRIGRWMAPDPAAEFFSPYLAMGNNPISTVDPDGACTDCLVCPDRCKGLNIDAIPDGQAIWSGDNGDFLDAAFNSDAFQFDEVTVNDWSLYWADVNALAVNLNKQQDLATGKSTAIRAREAQAELDKPTFQTLVYQQPVYEPPLIHPFDLLSGGGTFVFKFSWVKKMKIWSEAQKGRRLMYHSGGKSLAFRRRL